MQYLITFLEGMISFISPCMLPMLPLYISYFGGGAKQKRHVFVSALSFVVGFTVVFGALGLFAGSIGSLLIQYKTAVNVICGILIIVFGLNYLEIIHLPFFKGMQYQKRSDGIFSAFLFGMVYSVSLTPCVGAFLGSALMMASASGKAAEGLALLVVYALGLGIPFLISAVLIEKLNTAFSFIKNHYRIINLVCGIFLILVGVLMIFGLFGRMLAFFS